jgi:hypothetical protein
MQRPGVIFIEKITFRYLYAHILATGGESTPSQKPETERRRKILCYNLEVALSNMQDGTKR